MKKQEFFALLATEFNVDDDTINESTVLTEIPDWDSMSILVVMSLVDERFEITLSANDFTKINKVSDLISFIGKEKFDG